MLLKFNIFNTTLVNLIILLIFMTISNNISLLLGTFFYQARLKAINYLPINRIKFYYWKCQYRNDPFSSVILSNNLQPFKKTFQSVIKANEVQGEDIKKTLWTIKTAPSINTKFSWIRVCILLYPTVYNPLRAFVYVLYIAICICNLGGLQESLCYKHIASLLKMHGIYRGAVVWLHCKTFVIILFFFAK